MSESRQQALATIDREIAALAARKQALLVAVSASWPKQVTLYASCDKDSNWKKGEALGLTGEALRLFVHFEEFRLDVEVAQDGMVRILRCDGKALQP